MIAMAMYEARARLSKFPFQEAVFMEQEETVMTADWST
ncbi:lysin B [Salmonella phage 39]|nr:lysin B [Salmonella phage 39]